jgi:hypothetical protein
MPTLRAARTDGVPGVHVVMYVADKDSELAEKVFNIDTRTDLRFSPLFAQLKSPVFGRT